MEGEQLRLLLVEDDDGYARIIPRALTRSGLGFEMVRATSMDEARRLPREGHFDAVLLDLSLPDSEGQNTFVNMRRLVVEAPIIVLTASDDRRLALEAVKAGAQDYLVKGQVDLLSLARSIRYAVERQLNQTEQNRRIARLGRLRDVDDELTRRLDTGYVLRMAMDAALRLSAASAGIIGILEEGALVLSEDINYAPRLIAGIALMEQGIVGRALRQRQAQCVTDVGQDPDYIRIIEETQAQIAIPLVSQDRLIGFLNLETRTPARFNQETFEFLKLLAARIATHMDNARLYGQSQQQLEQLRQLEQIKTDMIRIATHDLRTPISNIMGYGYLLRQALCADPNAELCTYLDSIEHSAERMRTITDDILSLERVESMKSLSVQRVNLNELSQRAYYESRERAQQKRQHLDLDIPRRPLIVQGDPGLLYEAMSNLVNNAIKYTPERGQVQLRLQTRSGGAVFEVEDTGYGIPEDQQARLFQPFFRARSEETMDIAGTGLGLHLVKSIVERHGGQLVFHSVYGKGSTFGFRLPFKGSSPLKPGG